MRKKNVVFVNFGGLGDEILFLPTILSFKAQYPDTKITLILEERSKGIVTLTDIIDEVITVKFKKLPQEKFINRIFNIFNKSSEIIKLLFKIWGKNYDLIVSSGSSNLIALFLFCTLIKKRIGYNSGILSEKLLTKTVELNKNQYAVNMYQDLISPLTDIKTELPILNIEKKQVLPNSVLIHPGVSKMSIERNMIKTISAETWAKVINILADSGKKVFLAGGPDDFACISTITKLVDSSKYTNLYGQTSSLRDLAELISSAEKFVCSDSAPLHIAISLGVKTYVIFGSTDDKKLIPQSDNVVPIKIKSACPLQPCLWEKRQTTCDKLLCLQLSEKYIAETVLLK